MKTVQTLSLIAFFILLGCQRGEQEVVIVPTGFKGYILVIFNQKNGTKPRYEGNKRIYTIPENGVFKTQFKGNYGQREFTEFYYERIAQENKIHAFGLLRDVPMDTIGAFIGAVGTVKRSSESEERIEFAEFYIGTKEGIVQGQEQVEKLDIVKLADQ